MKIYRYYFFLCVFLVSSCASHVKSNQHKLDIIVRILLKEGTNFYLKPKGQYILSIGDEARLSSGTLRIAYLPNGILVNGIAYKTHNIELQGLEYFSFNGKIYRGDVSIHSKDKQLKLVNRVSIEDYLLSVIPAEVYSSWDLNALKAQTVASRTYALYEIRRKRKNRNSCFDLYADTRSQVYPGVSSEKPKVSQAVRQTVGQVITYQGDIIKSYFSASLGGMSADGIEIGDQQSYLKSVFLPPNPKDPSRKWIVKISAAQLQKKLQYKNPIKSILLLSRTSSGRMDKIQIVDTAHQTNIITASKLRTILGHSTMKSTLAKITVHHKHLIIQGQGYGHGIGMGQWDAQTLALKGYSYPNILMYFYKDTVLSPLY